MADQTSTIPKGWKMTTLGNQIKVGRGSSPRPIQDFLSDRGIPWVKIADASASETRYIVKTKECIKEEGRSTSVKVGDLIVSNSATPGIPKFMGINACVHDGWLVFSDYKDLDKLYLYYFFLDYRRTLEHSASGTVFVNLQTEIVRNIEMNLPSLPEQQAIASVLSSLDDKIELSREQNKTLEATAQAIFKEWFVNFNFPGANGKMIDSELGQIPEGWRVGKLGDILSNIESGSRPKGGIDSALKNGIPSVGAESIDGVGNYNFSGTKYVTKDFFDLMKRGLVKDYDILIYKDGAYVGKKAMFGLGFPFDIFAVNEHVFILRTNKISNQFFLYFLLKQEELSQLNTNSAQPGLNQEAIKNLRILIPQVDSVNKFGQIVNLLIDKILINSKQIQTLSALRDALLPRLMKGEVRVEEFNS